MPYYFTGANEIARLRRCAAARAAVVAADAISLFTLRQPPPPRCHHFHIDAITPIAAVFITPTPIARQAVCHGGYAKNASAGEKKKKKKKKKKNAKRQVRRGRQKKDHARSAKSSGGKRKRRRGSDARDTGVSARPWR
jgi:hypothetical protein